jgi:transcriptional regulator with XRE-family HTH domain
MCPFCTQALMSRWKRFCESAGEAMSERDAFGPNLRRTRIQRGISLESIAAATKISIDLLSGLERNDLSRWPTGIYARAYIRAYATQIGADPEGIVDAFCRWFPQGDRRAERVVRDQASMVGHELQWRDDLVGLVVKQDRRASSRETDTPTHVIATHGRLIAAAADAAVVVAAGLAVASLLPVSKGGSIAVVGLLYHAVTIVAVGCTPAVWAIEHYMASRHPSARRRGQGAELRLMRRSSDSVQRPASNSPVHEHVS